LAKYLQASYDKETVEAIIKAQPLLHVSFNASFSDESLSGFPTILPMLGAMGTYPGDEDASVYLHGSSSARLSRLTSGHENDGLPVCVSATVLDGYVLALTPFNHSCNYRSAVVFGHAKKLEDNDEILFAMELITNRLVPDRWSNSRTPPSKSEITATGIMKVQIATASAKIRSGIPHDDRKDVKDETVTERIWTGVVPSYEVLGDPMTSGDGKITEVPGHVRDWVAQTNASVKQHALDASKE